MTQAEHNAPQWLIVRLCPSVDGGRGMREGWYVVRICPCHFGERVTLPYISEKRARQARYVIINGRHW